jgi:hypothetical protein
MDIWLTGLLEQCHSTSKVPYRLIPIFIPIS